MKRVLAISGGVDSMVLLDFCVKKGAYWNYLQYAPNCALFIFLNKFRQNPRRTSHIGKTNSCVAASRYGCGFFCSGRSEKLATDNSLVLLFKFFRQFLHTAEKKLFCFGILGIVVSVKG